MDPSDLGKKARTVIEGITAVALLWFCLWAGFTLAHIKDGVDNLTSTRDAQLMQRSEDNAANILNNTDRLDDIQGNGQ
jgi:hypothetical protein